MSHGKIAIAMSGGVDSSVAAALLADQGESAFGLMLRLWSPAGGPPNRCCSPEDMAAALLRYCINIRIPLPRSSQKFLNQHADLLALDMVVNPGQKLGDKVAVRLRKNTTSDAKSATAKKALAG